jgi:hypothetical protein
MEEEAKDSGNIMLKVILYVFFISAFLTIITFMLGQGWFNIYIEKLSWPYETLEIVRNILVNVFIAAAIASFISSITAVVLLIFRN